MERVGQLAIYGMRKVGVAGFGAMEKITGDVSGLSCIGAVVLACYYASSFLPDGEMAKYYGNLKKCKSIDPRLGITLPSGNYSHVDGKLLKAHAQATGQKKQDLTCDIFYEQDRQVAQFWRNLQGGGAFILGVVSRAMDYTSRGFRHFKLKLQ